MPFNKFYISTILSAFIIGWTVPVQAKEGNKLVFDPTDGKQATLTMPSGENIAYTAYENIFYVTNIEDSVYQTLNIYVPEILNRGDSTPVFLRTYIGGYMANHGKISICIRRYRQSAERGICGLHTGFKRRELYNNTR